MTKKEMQRLINQTAKALRKEHNKHAPKDNKLIEINWGLPYVGIKLPTDQEYFFQGEEASNLLEEAVNASNKFETSVENALLWMSQSW